MVRRLAVLAVLFTVSSASRVATAGPPRLEASVRLSGAVGVLEQMTWAAPGVDLVGTLRLGASRRAHFGVQLGYAPVDNHTFLSDGLLARAALMGGTELAAGKIGLDAIVAVDYVAFHADPDVLEDHPGVDLLARRDSIVPVVGVEAAYRVRDAMRLGLFARVGLSTIELFRDQDGVSGDARLVLAGFFIEFRLR